MQNPISKIFEKSKSFTFFHTHVIDRAILDAAVAAKKSLEVDLSIDPAGKVYVGHPLAMYEFFRMPPPNNLPLEIVIKEMKVADLFLILDCKDVLVLPKAQEIIESYGAENCLLHCCTEELVFKPYSKKIIVEPHWDREQIPLEPILKVKQATGVPLALCCRGISKELLEARGEDAIISKILEVAKGKAEIIVPNLPKDEVPPMSLMQKLLDSNILSLIGIDHTPPEKRPLIFVGATDVLELASDPKEFS